MVSMTENGVDVATTRSMRSPAARHSFMYSVSVRSWPVSIASIVRSIIFARCGSLFSGTMVSTINTRVPGSAAAVMFFRIRRLASSSQSCRM